MSFFTICSLRLLNEVFAVCKSALMLLLDSGFLVWSFVVLCFVLGFFVVFLFCMFLGCFFGIIQS